MSEDSEKPECPECNSPGEIAREIHREDADASSPQEGQAVVAPSENFGIALPHELSDGEGSAPNATEQPEHTEIPQDLPEAAPEANTPVALPGASPVESVQESDQKADIPSPPANVLGDNIVLENLTLGRGKDYVEYVLPAGIVLDEWEPDGSPWKERRQLRLEEKDGILRVVFKGGETGTFDFPVYYNGGQVAQFHLTVNPDPWSLWKVIDPEDPGLFGEHDRERLERHHMSTLHHEDGTFSVAGASRRGRSHEHTGSFRDDDMGYWADEGTGRYVFMVADGAGSARFSREGSRMAIEYLKGKLPANLTAARWDADGADPQPDGQVGQLLAALARHAFDRITDFVKAENEKHPEAKWEVRDFNTTLLVAAVKLDADGGMRLVTFSVGDGAIAWFDGEKSRLMCAPDGGEFSGGTRFLTMRSVWEKASRDWSAFCRERVFCQHFSPEETRRTTLFLMTDGVSDPWFETDAALADSGMWRKFAEETLVGDGVNQAGLRDGDSAEVKAEKLLDWLHFRIPGNHDDRTLVVVAPAKPAGKEDGHAE